MGRKKKRADGFPKEYWDRNYADLDDMDGIANAKTHAQYLKELMTLEMVEINSVVDFGFGLGHLLKEMIAAFKPYRALGIEPSEYAFHQASIRKLKKNPHGKLVLENINLREWSEGVKPSHKHFDLGICTSVFQYLEKSDLEFILPIMARQVKYLYFSVPTDLELKRQVSELEFEDTYAKRRSQKYYLKLLKPHFTFISSRLLESKVHFSQDNTLFTDLLFRFE